MASKIACLNLIPFKLKIKHKISPRRPHDAPRRPKTFQDVPKTVPGRLQNDPNTPPRRLKIFPRRPKTALNFPRHPKMLPRRPKTPPRRLQTSILVPPPLQQFELPVVYIHVHTTNSWKRRLTSSSTSHNLLNDFESLFSHIQIIFNCQHKPLHFQVHFPECQFDFYS